MVKQLFHVLWLLSALNCISQEKIVLYTFYTPSHEQLLSEWFLPSLQDNFEIVVKQFEQTCPSGTYMQKGWTQTMLRKVDLIIEAINEHWRSIIIYADIDIQFFAPIEQEIRKSLQGKDLVVQRDNKEGALCAGFMALRANQRCLRLFKKIRQYMIDHPGISDQPTLNKLLLKERYSKISWDYLPVSFFGTATLSQATFANKKTWHEGDTIVMPPDMLLHHANYTTSIKNKIKLLAYVKLYRNQPQHHVYYIHDRIRKQKRKERLQEKQCKRATGMYTKKRRIKKRG